MNSFCRTQQLMWSPFTMALAKNSLMNSTYTFPLGFSNFVQVLSLNTSGMEVFSRVSISTTLSMITVAFYSGRYRPCLPQWFWSPLSLCVDTLRFLGSKVLSGRHLHKQTQSREINAKIQNKNTNLISTKLVHKTSTKS